MFAKIVGGRVDVCLGRGLGGQRVDCGRERRRMRRGLLVVGTVWRKRPIVWWLVVKAWLPEVGCETFGGGPRGSARAWSSLLAMCVLHGGCKRCG